MTCQDDLCVFRTFQVIEGVRNLSEYASVIIHDHLGGVEFGGGCAIEECDQVLSLTVPLAPNIEWSISIGQVRYDTKCDM